MPQTLYWDPSTVIVPLGGGIVRLFQPFWRRNLLATMPIVEVADLLAAAAAWKRCKRSAQAWATV